MGGLIFEITLYSSSCDEFVSFVVTPSSLINWRREGVNSPRSLSFSVSYDTPRKCCASCIFIIRLNEYLLLFFINKIMAIF